MGDIVNINKVATLKLGWLVAYWNDLTTGMATCSGECGDEFIKRNADFQVEWEPVDEFDEIKNCVICEKGYN
jgi:hypothetical protein